MKTKLLALWILASFVVTFATGCPPKKDAIRQAAEASYRLPAATVDILDRTAAARDAGTIDAATAQRIGRILEPIARAEVVFVGMVRAAHTNAERIEALGKTTNLSKDDAAELVSRKAQLTAQTSDIKRYFDLEIITPFLSVLEVAKLISGTTSQAVVLAITAARLIIETIGSALKSSKVKELAFQPVQDRPPERLAAA